MKKIAILLMVIISATGVFAEKNSLRDRTENWLQGSDTETSSGSLRGAIGANEDSEGELAIPVGEGLLVLSLFAIGFATVKKRKSKKTDIKVVF